MKTLEKSMIVLLKWERKCRKGEKTMPKLNENYQNLEESYLFAEIARRG